jgi:hypothetical protein
VAEEQKDWEEAERCYREAVRIREQIQDLPELAKSFNQLAIVAKRAGRPDEAERWYMRAIELDEQLGNPKGVAVDYSNLAALYLSQCRLDEAEAYARRALEIKETLDLSAEPWKTYAILAQIAEARGHPDEAARWRRKEQESYAAYAGAAHQMRQYETLITAAVRAAQGDPDAATFVEGEYPKMRAGGEEWARNAAAIQRILQGERDTESLVGSLGRTGALLVRTILARLSEPVLSEVEGAEPTTPPAQVPPSPEQEGAGAAIARLRQRWAPVIGAVVAVAEAGAPVPAELDAFLNEIGDTDDWHALVAVLRRIMAGERDPAALLPGLDATDTLIAGEVLRGLGVETGTPPLQEPDADAGGEQLGLSDLFNMVAQACHPDAPPGLAEQLHALTRQMSGDPNAPAEIQALGRVLNRVLSGDRDPDLSALPPELAEAVRKLLEVV